MAAAPPARHGRIRQRGEGLVQQVRANGGRGKIRVGADLDLVGRSVRHFVPVGGEERWADVGQDDGRHVDRRGGHGHRHRLHGDAGGIAGGEGEGARPHVRSGRRVVQRAGAGRERIAARSGRTVQRQGWCRETRRAHRKSLRQRRRGRDRSWIRAENGRRRRRVRRRGRNDLRPFAAGFARADVVGRGHRQPRRVGRQRRDRPVQHERGRGGGALHRHVVEPAVVDFGER